MRNNPPEACRLRARQPGRRREQKGRVCVAGFACFHGCPRCWDVHFGWIDIDCNRSNYALLILAFL